MAPPFSDATLAAAAHGVRSVRRLSRAIFFLMALPTIAGYYPTARHGGLPRLHVRAGPSTSQLGDVLPAAPMAFTTVELPGAIAPPLPFPAAAEVPAPYVASAAESVSSMVVEAPPFELPPLPVAAPAPLAEQQLPVPEAARSVPKLGELAGFALPMLAMWLSSPLLSLIDTSVVGKVASTAALAALGPSTKTCDNIAYFASVIGAATTNIAAERFAEGRADKATRVVAGSLTMSLVIGVGISVSLASCAAPLMMGMMGSASSAAADSAIQYTAIRALGFPFALATMVLQAAFLACKDSRSPMLAVPFVGFINLVLDLLLVGPMKMGTAGAAWATVTAQVANAAILLRIWTTKLAKIALENAPATAAFPDSDGPLGIAPQSAPGLLAGSPLSFGGQNVNAIPAPSTQLLVIPTKDEMMAVSTFAGPMILGIGSRSYMGLAFTSGVAALGTVSLAAHQIVDSLYWLFAPFGEAVSLCMQAYMPELLRHSEAAAQKLRALGLKGAGMLCGVVGGLGAALLSFTPGLFCSAPSVHAVMGSAAPMLGAAVACYMVAGALEGALTARKQLKALAASHVVNTGLVVFSLKAVLSSASSNLRTVWALMAAVNLARIVQFGLLLSHTERVATRAEKAAEAAEQGPKRVRLFLRRRHRAVFMEQ